MAQVTEDLKQAMKDRDKLKTSVLRMVLSEFKYALTGAQAGEAQLPDSEAFKIFEGYFKRLDKSLKDYPDGDRKSQILQELEILKPYLPRKMTASELSQAIDEDLANQADRHFGSLMKHFVAKFGQDADPKMISAQLKEKLGQ